MGIGCEEDGHHETRGGEFATGLNRYSECRRSIKNQPGNQTERTMPKGGPREGAGRPRGSRGRRTKDSITKAEALGPTPLEVLLESMHAARAAGERASRRKTGTMGLEFGNAPIRFSIGDGDRAVAETGVVFVAH
jgi:hypothetical protein